MEADDAGESEQLLGVLERRENSLENELEKTDDSIFFSFVVAEVRSAGP